MNLGSEMNGYYAVAVARRRDSYLTLFNLKRKSSLRSASGSAVGSLKTVCSVKNIINFIH